MPLIDDLFVFQDFLVNFEIKQTASNEIVAKGQFYQSAPSRQTAIWLVKSRLEKEHEGKHVDVIVH